VIAAALLIYAVLLLTAGAPPLARSGWPDRAPRLAVFAWLALAWSAVTSAVLGGLALLVPEGQVSGGLAGLLADCEMTLRARYAHPGGAALAIIGGVLAVMVGGRLAWCTAGVLAAGARAGRRHHRRLRLAGRADPRLGAVVVDYGEPAVYCLPGAGRPVVVTTAALRALDTAQLAAVLAHERAHQAGRHHLLVALAAVPAAAFPLVPALRTARDEVARLAELAADDAAAACSPRLTVAGALLTLGTAPAGTAALGAGGSTAAARVRRMIAAPDPISRTAAAGVKLAIAALVVLPLALLAGPTVTALVAGHCSHSPVAAADSPR
jgi:Zn-dependent protease with chaperone function